MWRDNIEEHLRQLDEQGYTVVRDFLERDTTRRIREHMDALIGPVLPPSEENRPLHTLRHPIPGEIMAEILNRKELLDLAKAILFSNDLRLLEQVLIRTDPSLPPHGAGGWHIDFAFLPRHYDARPRQTYFHMVHALNTVEPGGGAFNIVPGSHKLNYASSAKIGSTDKLDELKNDPINVSGIDLNDAIEVLANDGDLIIFNPMALHSGSKNKTSHPRYVYFASFMDASADYLWNHLRESKYRDNFPDSLRENLPPELHVLLQH